MADGEGDSGDGGAVIGRHGRGLFRRTAPGLAGGFDTFS